MTDFYYNGDDGKTVPEQLTPGPCQEEAGCLRLHLVPSIRLLPLPNAQQEGPAAGTHAGLFILLKPLTKVHCHKPNLKIN